MKEHQGKLYIVSTPIGNLEDITLRALRTLKEVDLIAAENTKKTRKLLSHFSISKPLTSYYSYNEKKKGYKLVNIMEEGSNIALVSEAGSPGISDPSYHLVSLALEKDIEIIPIPGPTAFVSALISSGLKIDRFFFEGFLPRKKGKRKKRLERFLTSDITFIFYESPYRIIKTLKELNEILGNRKIALARELTKLYEEIIRGNILEVIEKVESRKKLGEITVVVEGISM